MRPSLLVLVVPAQGLVDGLVELLGRERLLQVAVGPDPHARGAVVRVLQRGHHDDRDEVRLAVPLELVADGESVEVGEHQVEQDQIGLLLGHGRPDLRTRIELDRFEVASPNETGQDIVGVALIVDDQNGARHGQNSKKQPNSDPVLSLPTTADMAHFIFTRRSKRGKGLEPTRSPAWPVEVAFSDQAKSIKLSIGLGLRVKTHSRILYAESRLQKMRLMPA